MARDVLDSLISMAIITPENMLSSMLVDFAKNGAYDPIEYNESTKY